MLGIFGKKKLERVREKRGERREEREERREKREERREKREERREKREERREKREEPLQNGQFPPLSLEPRFCRLCQVQILQLAEQAGGVSRSRMSLKYRPCISQSKTSPKICGFIFKRKQNPYLQSLAKTSADDDHMPRVRAGGNLGVVVAGIVVLMTGIVVLVAGIVVLVAAQDHLEFLVQLFADRYKLGMLALKTRGTLKVMMASLATDSIKIFKTNRIPNWFGLNMSCLSSSTLPPGPYHSLCNLGARVRYEGRAHNSTENWQEQNSSSTSQPSYTTVLNVSRGLETPEIL
ncbi:hypothetical protein HGM15179_008038 [Zosterops borbonicus]|uniref:Uncharacterized protein n=1 Tax=Zosterops borbonicus TaxID=364589 RepID=A0A8K1GKC2_9PASS|nr:hypothetical protein HGM15179_008038 [Zosterops borbonicus]